VEEEVGREGEEGDEHVVDWVNLGKGAWEVREGMRDEGEFGGKEEEEEEDLIGGRRVSDGCSVRWCLRFVWGWIK
jgi:hypothetical protein